MNLTPVYATYVQQLANETDDFLFPIPTAFRPYLSDIRPGENFREFEKIPISFWLNQTEQVTISVLDQDGESLTSFSHSGTRGLNQFRWNLVLNTIESPEPYFINYKQYLKPGRYRVQLETADGKTLEQELSVTDDSQAK